MKIISKQGKGFRDFYDYIQGILGQDELVVYDRRNAFPIDPTKNWGCDERRECPSYCSDYQNLNIEKWFKKEVICGDKKREKVTLFHSRKILNENGEKVENKGLSYRRRTLETKMEGNVYHFVLEVGYHRYYFEVERYIDDDDMNKVHLKYGLVEKADIEKKDKITEAPVCLCPVTYYPHFYDEKRRFTIVEDQKIDNPILYSTYIPKFVNEYEMWNNIYEYISSLRDKEFTDTRTNDEHIESHGFDKKISFRHRK